jgi:Domain of unknown function (DUF4279)
VSNHEFTVSLGVRHPDIDPAQITRALGLQPRHAWRKGETRLDSTGTALAGTHRESYWVCELTPHPELSGERTGVESELFRVLDTLRRTIGFMQDLRHGGGAAELFITIFARGDFRLELLAEEAALLGRLGVAMTIEIKALPVGTSALNMSS